MLNKINEEDMLILVDESDKPWGKLEKKLVHQLGTLHRAFSVFIFNSKGELLLQQRARDKYHSGGLWTNTCCSHPRFGEDTEDAVARRLKEEMGLDCTTQFAFTFQYKTNFENGLIENELDHVFIGMSDKLPTPDNSEVDDWKYISLKDLKREVYKNPEMFTVWFKLVFEKASEFFNMKNEREILKSSSLVMS